MSILQIKRTTAAAWTAANPILAIAEQGWETDTKKLKIGDGVTAWASLPYAFVPAKLLSVSIQVAAAAPTTREDGSALVTNDIWFDI